LSLLHIRGFGALCESHTRADHPEFPRIASRKRRSRCVVHEVPPEAVRKQ
jgi:hypothetical protein